MKNTNIILAALALLLTVSCSRKVEFQHETFVTFDDVTFSVNEGVGTVSIPVSLYNPNGQEVQVTVTSLDGEGEKGALEGTDYDIISPASGILTFAGGENTLYIEVDLKHNKALTGTKTFSVQINSATDGISVGGFNVATVKILDDEHPLASMIGEWSGTLSGATGTNYETTFNIDAVDDDDTFTQLKLDSGIDPMFGKGSKVMYSALASGNTISVQSKQLNGYENYYLQGLTVDSYLADYFYFAMNPDGTLSLATPYAVMAPGIDNGYDAPMEIYFAGTFVKK